ncbi:argonaute-like protein [Mycena polygramma]|nr:argonaute-like protein [Mycena polygramma]
MTSFPGATPVSVVTNSFLVKRLPHKTYYQYDMFTPPNPKPQQRQRLVHAMQTSVYPQVFSPRAVYDGNRLLYASHIISDGQYRIHTSNQNAAHDAPGWYTIQVSRTAGQPITPIMLNQLVQKGKATSQTSMAINIMQLLLCQAKNQASPNTGNRYFLPEGKKKMPGIAVELWRGFYQTVRPTIGRMLVTVDTAITPMYMPGSLIDVAMAVLNANTARSLALDANHENFKKLQRFLKGRLFTIKTGDGPPRTKTVRDLVPGPVGQYEFCPGGSGATTTIAEHYFKTYHITLQYPNMIGVVTSPNSAPFKVVIPLELCTLVPGQQYKKKLPPEVTQDVRTFASLTPAKRLQMIVGEGAPRSPVQDYDMSEFLVDAGMQIEKRPLTIAGHLLPPPGLVYDKSPSLHPRDGAWKVNRFYRPAHMQNWAILNFDPYRIVSDVFTQTVKSIVNHCSNLGMTVSNPVHMRTGNAHNTESAIEKACIELGGAHKVDMIVVLLPASAEAIRTSVKFLCDVKFGVRSQCLRQTKLQNATSQYFKNICLKLNARLGGVNAVVDSPILAEIMTEPTMIMGADVTHPPPGANRPSVASLVWSYDKVGVKYCATTRVQLPRMEIIQDLKEMVKMAVIMFGDQHRTPPSKVIFFRDGVSEGEFAAVEQAEIGEIKAAFDAVWIERKVPVEMPKPRLTFIVVGKRHHVTFFPSPNEQIVKDGKTGNCRPGLVVHTGLSNPRFPDFYLQSHMAIQSTSRSAHYTILRDELFHCQIDKLAELSFALCHAYAKATCSVSIPAPVYYADLACARSQFHLDPDAGMTLEDSATGGQDEFSLDPWVKAYNAINERVKGSMYFL